MANNCNFGQMDNKKAEVIEALKDCHGIVTDACRKADVPRSTFYVWLKDDPDFKAAYEDTLEQAIDFVEGKLFEKINGVTVRKGVDDETGEDITYDLPPSDTALIFFLKTKAKKRGYIERQEVVPMDPDGNSIQPVININVVNPVKDEENKSEGL